MAGCDSDSGDRSQGRMALVQQIQPGPPTGARADRPGCSPGGPGKRWRLRGGLARARGHFCRAGRRVARTLKTRLFVGLTYKAEMGL